MKSRGVHYDVGRVMLGQDWRPDFDLATVQHELAIIRDDLHANAVRLCGQDLDRLRLAAETALNLGLEVWLSPELWDHSPDDTLDHLAEAAAAAGRLEAEFPGQLVLSLGSELSLFMQGILAGDTFLDRFSRPDIWDNVRAGAHNPPLNAFLQKAATVARKVFSGRLTYASAPLEGVDWTPFDIVSTDLYRDARTRDRFVGLVERFLAFNKPLAITEFGCCTYQGAANAGGMGWAIIDVEKTPQQLKGDYVRDEAEQAAEIETELAIFNAAGVEAAFVMTFVAPLFPASDEPRFDLDLASYALVRSLPAGRLGRAYPGLPWEPKRAFHALAQAFARMAEAEAVVPAA